MENEDFKKNIEKLFMLFRKVLEKYPPEEIPGIDKAQLDHLKAYLAQYEHIKDYFSIDMYGLTDNEETRKFIEKLTRKLCAQYGDEETLDSIPPLEEEKDVDGKEKVFELFKTGESYQAFIDAIDDKLADSNLTMEEIDDLLDKRQSLKNKN